MKKVGIYCFTNKINLKQYIGQSIDIDDRIKQHKYRYKIINDSGYKSAFHSALRKYGWDNFSIKVLEECSIDQLDEKERFWIKKFNTIVPNGYNILEGGQKNRMSFNRICPICGKIKESSATVCQECRKTIQKESSILQQKDININLIDKILATSFEQVAKDYGYKSGNSIKKCLIKAGLPSTKEKLLLYYKEQTGHIHISEQKKKERQLIKEANRKKIKPRIVEQYDLENNLIATFASTQEAYRKTGISSGHISECCNGKRKQVKGFIWKYRH